MLNFFYLSQRYLEKLVEVYQGMGKQWAFFESLFPTLTGVYDLKWTTFTPKKHFMHGSKPCHTNLTEKGLYHPVKYRDGKPFPCHCFVGYWKCAPWNSKFVPGAKECSDCPAARATGNFTLNLKEQDFINNLAQLANRTNDTATLKEIGHIGFTHLHAENLTTS
jgi:hypothetical protein